MKKNEYEVTIDRLELSRAANGSPAVLCCLNVLKGKYQGRRIIMEQKVNRGDKIFRINQFLWGLVHNVGIPVNVTFTASGGFLAYGEMIMDISKAIGKDQPLLLDLTGCPFEEIHLTKGSNLRGSERAVML